MHRKIVCQLQIPYLETYQRLIWLLGKAQFLATAHLSFRYSASPNYLSTANLPIISPLEIVYLFGYSALKIIWQTSHSLFANISTIYIGTVHHTINFPLHNSQLFVYCKSTNYFTTRYSLNLWLLCVEKLYENFKSHIWKYIKDLYGYCAKPIFRVLRIYLLLLPISQLFMYCISTNYFTTGNRLHNCLLCIETLYDNFKSPIWKHINDLYGYYAKQYCSTTANRPNISPLEIV